MQKSTDTQGSKWFAMLAALVAMIAFGVFVGWTAIQGLPAQEQEEGLRWFAAGWGITTAGAALAYLPRWLNTRIVTKTEHQRGLQVGWAIAMASIGPVIIGSRLGFLGPGFGLVVGSAICGMASFILGLVPVALFTKRGRALRARQLEHNQSPTS